MGQQTAPPIVRSPDIPQPVGRALRTFSWILLLVVVYVYGWQVTQINLRELVTKAPLVKPIILDLLKPDLIEHRPRGEEAQAEIWLDRTPPSPVIQQVPPWERLLFWRRPPAWQITLTPVQAKIGAAVTITGKGFTPSRPVDLVWLDQSGSTATIGKAETDASGRLQTTVKVPVVIGTDHHVVVRAILEGTTPGPSNALRLTASHMVETIFLALMGTTLAIIVAIPLSFLAAKNLMARSAVGSSVYYAVRTLFNITRSIEPLIWAIIFAVWVGIGPFAGVLALALHSVAALGKLYSEQIESIDPGPIEAITATGASMLQVVRYAVVPQIIPPFIAFTIYRWDINVRMSTVIGLVGGGGIGFLLIQYINLLQWRQAATAVWAITLVVAIMDYMSATVREQVV